MSKILDATITCPKCGKQYPVKLFRTIWGESPELRAKVMNDEVNICTCPHCSYSFHAPLAMMYVDVHKKFAVWWEPEYDSGIEEMSAGFTRMLGPNNYYVLAPRISDWQDFKDTINKYYSGELRGQSEEAEREQEKRMTEVANNLLANMKKQQKSKSGCMVTIALFVVSIGALLSLL